MGAIERVTPRNPSRQWFSEGINYAATGEGSIWGGQWPRYLNLIEQADVNGAWLNLACGDGRYNNALLGRENIVYAADIDIGALAKLLHVNTPPEAQHRVQPVRMDLTEDFPFGDETLDGIFCLGALHFFTPEILGKVFTEINRILKPGGKLLINLSTNIRRELGNGSFLVYENEPQYSLYEGLALLEEEFQTGRYTGEFTSHNTRPLDFPDANPPYTFTATVITALAEKELRS